MDTTNINTEQGDDEFLSRRCVPAYYLLGALLSRFNDAEINLPGGCTIGERPIDLHIKGMQALGANVKTEYGRVIANAPDGLRGCDIYMDKVSVGATINVMLASVCAEGQTSSYQRGKRAARCRCSQFPGMYGGAKIKGAGTDVIRITGVEKLHGCSIIRFYPRPNRNGNLHDCGGGHARRRNDQECDPYAYGRHLRPNWKKWALPFRRGADFIRVTCDKRPKAVKINTMPYPGFPTDLQQPATVLLFSTAKGTSMITETIFESRFKHIKEIRRMGAQITTEDRVAVVEGVDRLTGAPVSASDLRAGAALIVAGLMADGTTEIQNVKYIDRGYDHIEDKMRKLGADIRREEGRAHRG